MNRRSFLAASAAVATVAPSARADAKAADRLRVLVPAMPTEELSDLQAAAPGIELVVCRSEDEAVANAADADASYGFISARVLRAGKSIRWVQQPSAGVEHLIEIPELVEHDILLTNMQRAYAPEIADQAIGYLLALTRDLGHFLKAQEGRRWSAKRQGVVLDELAGKTMLVIGLGGIGSEIARRAFGFGVRVLATDPKVLERPLFVDELHRPDTFHDLLPRADVVASAVPLTKASRKMIGSHEFGLMKQGVVLINVSRGKVVDTDALVAALDSGRVAAAGLDVTDPEPLPDGHPLWSRNVIITPHTAGQSPGGERRRREVLRENLRRFAAGESLLNIVDKKAGY
ncbi:MAG: D-2-hydroxyacid dehydrogenase [Paludisphaera borealis]|uniref:D-2-hydroxyacid dehydrogenase n=1 Tax=Paludisphaera borealis TaxID=1387353 RepID=UPI0028493B6E|nr:D-2-hydroxyacid dehydrogenase [Paludisphaera borealis]MDR3619994.1 D-2-hydroxyacid dehydrogenase [Paludisphaera borealis]